MFCVLKLIWEKKIPPKNNWIKKIIFLADLDGQGANIHFVIIKMADHDNF